LRSSFRFQRQKKKQKNKEEDSNNNIPVVVPGSVVVDRLVLLQDLLFFLELVPPSVEVQLMRNQHQSIWQNGGRRGRRGEWRKGLQ
jgi:hypothetical protein